MHLAFYYKTRLYMQKPHKSQETTCPDFKTISSEFDVYRLITCCNLTHSALNLLVPMLCVEVKHEGTDTHIYTHTETEYHSKFIEKPGQGAQYNTYTHTN